jgi:hypothetical protein
MNLVQQGGNFLNFVDNDPALFRQFGHLTKQLMRFAGQTQGFSGIE